MKKTTATTMIKNAISGVRMDKFAMMVEEVNQEVLVAIRLSTGWDLHDIPVTVEEVREEKPKTYGMYGYSMRTKNFGLAKTYNGNDTIIMYRKPLDNVPKAFMKDVIRFVLTHEYVHAIDARGGAYHTTNLFSLTTDRQVEAYTDYRAAKVCLRNFGNKFLSKLFYKGQLCFAPKIKKAMDEAIENYGYVMTQEAGNDIWTAEIMGAIK